MGWRNTGCRLRPVFLSPGEEDKVLSVSADLHVSDESSLPVSVLMTTFNGVKYLRETIDSILGQTWQDFEFVIIDDCSTDQTVEIIRSYSDPRIVLVENENNIGISESRNKAIRRARGEYIFVTDQDDVSEPERIKLQLSYLRVHPDIDVLGARVYFIKDGARVEDDMRVLTEPYQIEVALFFARHNLTYSSMALKRKFVREHDVCFRAQYHYAEDYELYHRMALSGRLSVLPDALVGYRLHESNNSKIKYDEMTRNGVSFMRDAYARVLAREVDEVEGCLIWHGLIEKLPQTSTSDLRKLGALTAKVMSAFESRNIDDKLRCDWIRQFCSMIWFDVVERSLQKLGFDALRVYDEFDQLHEYKPGVVRKAKALGVCLLTKMKAASS